MSVMFKKRILNKTFKRKVFFPQLVIKLAFDSFVTQVSRRTPANEVLHCRGYIVEALLGSLINAKQV